MKIDINNASAFGDLVRASRKAQKSGKTMQQAVLASAKTF